MNYVDRRGAKVDFFSSHRLMSTPRLHVRERHSFPLASHFSAPMIQEPVFRDDCVLVHACMRVRVRVHVHVCVDGLLLTNLISQPCNHNFGFTGGGGGAELRERRRVAASL